jgi:hypothetical protein
MKRHLVVGVLAVVALSCTANGNAATTSTSRSSEPDIATIRPADSVVANTDPAPDDLHVAPTVTLDCSSAIGSQLPPADYEIVGDVVALPTARSAATALQTGTTHGTVPATRLYAKAGLFVRRGSAFQLVVPPSLVGQLAIGWGKPGRPALRLMVDGCESSSEWLNFPGGFWVPAVGCLPIEVIASTATLQVEVGIGAPCPDQVGPPQPTES